MAVDTPQKQRRQSASCRRMNRWRFGLLLVLFSGDRIVPSFSFLPAASISASTSKAATVPSGTSPSQNERRTPSFQSMRETASDLHSPLNGGPDRVVHGSQRQPTDPSTRQKPSDTGARTDAFQRTRGNDSASSREDSRQRRRTVTPSTPPRPSWDTVADPVQRHQQDTVSSDLRHGTFQLLAEQAATCLIESDTQRDARGKDATGMPSSATNWIDNASATILQRTIEATKLKLPNERTGIDRDEASGWIRWMKSSPTPLIVDLSKDFHEAANRAVPDQTLELIEQTREQFLTRLGCRIILLPSGAPLSQPLLEPTASIIYGKLIYGGVTRYRRLVASNGNRLPRKTGQRSDIMPTPNDNIAPWVQFGGPERMYEAMDIGPCAVLEVLLLPRGQALTPECNTIVQDMTIGNLAWRPHQMFNEFISSAAPAGELPDHFQAGNGGATPISLSGKERNSAFQNDFQSSVGGLHQEIDAIVRRVLDGRVIQPADEDTYSGIPTVVRDEVSNQVSTAVMEAEELKALGLTPVRGLLLYGPPGCGKTALAREIARALRARKPKIASAPELLDRWVGGSEKLVRSLFAEAEAELAACNGDATKSALHVIVIDEIDAVFRRRSAGEDSGEATRASVVNQILAKLDGVKSIDNILLIGMTNRRELLDEALLRPGRLEVQIEIPLPDKEGRREILQIHFDALRRRGRLSQPLCHAIDGVSGNRRGAGSTNEGRQPTKATGRKRDSVKRLVTGLWSGASSVIGTGYDLAADYATGGFSGADIAGLVRCAGSIALSRARQDGSGVEGLVVTLEDVKQALVELRK